MSANFSKNWPLRYDKCEIIQDQTIFFGYEGKSVDIEMSTESPIKN